VDLADFIVAAVLTCSMWDDRQRVDQDSGMARVSGIPQRDLAHHLQNRSRAFWLLRDLPQRLWFCQREASSGRVPTFR
jgi:hypothetical protein